LYRHRPSKSFIGQALITMLKLFRHWLAMKFVFIYQLEKMYF